MSRLALTLVVLFIPSLAVAAQTAPVSDPTAVSLALKSLAALTGGEIISDVTLSGNVISIAGSDNETGTGTFQAKGSGESRIDLNLSGGTRSDVRNVSNGIPAGAYKQNGANATAYAQHNCWTDASWFFPALSSLAQNTNTRFVFKYIGQEQLSGASVQHISISQVSPQDTKGVFQRLSAIDVYLDPTSFLPVAVTFNTHSDNDMNTNLPNQILFTNYHAVNGIQVPFHFQRLVNGGVVLDVNLTSAVFNTGIPDTSFSLQ